MRRLIPCAVLGLTLGACATVPSEPPAPPPPPPPSGPVSDVVYQCEDGTRFSIYFHENAATVTLADGTRLDLPQQRAASGIHYATPQHDFRGKGVEATWTVGRKVPTQCRTN